MSSEAKRSRDIPFGGGCTAVVVSRQVLTCHDSPTKAKPSPNDELVAKADINTDGDEFNQKSKIKNQKSKSLILHPKTLYLSQKEPLLVEKPAPLLFEDIEDDLFEDIEDPRISRREKMYLMADNYILSPLRIAVHNVARRFYERKNEVEMYIEQSEIRQKTIRYFAQK